MSFYSPISVLDHLLPSIIGENHNAIKYARGLQAQNRLLSLVMRTEEGKVRLEVAAGYGTSIATDVVVFDLTEYVNMSETF
jgi:hypothetical protein